MPNGETPNWKAYAKPGPYSTKLSTGEESQFISWVKQNKIPWQDSPTSDYDMRGFWKAQQSGDPNAKRAANLHFPDTWKTPYHKTFSRESQYALPTAGHWEGDKFVPPQQNQPQQVDTQDYVIKAPSATYRIRVPHGTTPEKALSTAAATNTQFAQEWPTIQAHINMKIKAGKMSPSWWGGAHGTAEQEKKVDELMKREPQMTSDLRSLALVPAGASIGSELASKVPGFESLPKVVKLLTRSYGAGAGAGVGSLASGESPKEALKTGMEATALEGTVSPFMRWLASSKTRGAKLLQMAESKAGNLPVELSPKTNEVVEQIVEQGKLGGKTPKVISDLLERVGPSERMAAQAKPGALTYREARILQGNASQLTAEESAALKGRTKGLLKQFSKSFAEDVQKTADQAGVGKQHAAGMKEYAQASSRNRTLVRAAKGTAAGATTIGGYELLKHLLQQGHP